MIKIAPSLLAADFNNLDEEIKKINNSGADYLHLDVMDGVFVNNISFGFDIIKQVRKNTDIFFDVHLMIADPLKYIDNCSSCGSNMVTFHLESNNDKDYVLKTIKRIKENDMYVGISIKPNTNVELIYDYLELVDNVLIMSVEPGFGGQKFMADQLDKVKVLSNLKEKYNFTIEIDGGVNADNYKDCIESGCDILVAGSYLFNEEMSVKIKEMKNYAN